MFQKLRRHTQPPQSPMRAVKKVRELSTRLDGTIETLLARFSAATRELKPSIGPTEFVRRLTSCAARILDARTAALALVRGSEWELVSFHGNEGRVAREKQARLARALSELNWSATEASRSGSAAAMLGRSLAEALGAEDVAMARLTGSEGDLMGVLCLAGRDRPFTETDRHLLEALAGHASVALENARLFSWIERSKKQWIEDFDAISDFIVVHDASDRILRVNRSLAEHLRLRPSELIGRHMESLRA